MEDVSVHLGHLFAVLIMAVALGFDAFSLGIGIGMNGLRMRDMLRICAVVALFHILMPLTGMAMGQYMSSLLGDIAVMAAGALLMLLGGHMIYSSLRGEDTKSLNYRSGWAVTAFALSVSMDSFSVGVSLGMFRTNIFITILIFGLIGGIMSWLGLLLGSKVSRSLSHYGEAVGGAILFTFGILFMI